jgi:hypothetical protein
MDEKCAASSTFMSPICVELEKGSRFVYSNQCNGTPFDCTISLFHVRERRALNTLVLSLLTVLVATGYILTSLCVVKGCDFGQCPEVQCGLCVGVANVASEDLAD